MNIFLIIAACIFVILAKNTLCNKGRKIFCTIMALAEAIMVGYTFYLWTMVLTGVAFINVAFYFIIFIYCMFQRETDRI